MQTNRQQKSAIPPDYSVSDMTIAAEFIMTAMRAAVNGHPVASADVVRPLKWARSKIDEVLAQAEAPSATVVPLANREA
ncbi:hypothetical protein [Agrobacterium deltaense]|uniref:hypothetical protein n=1 Tax=Agrobacterium deltaense TaxID=1183412 RepID=UPI000F62F6A1|nr:hypothetical protein [Agrobacterium deltaense]RRN75997.1 hypothetical protein EIQ31_02645 [Agrobacterium deltaense]